MIELIPYLIASTTGFAAGVGTYSWVLRKDQEDHPYPAPGHEHVFDPWTDPEAEDLYDRKGDVVVGEVISQQRTCITCGYLDRRLDTYNH